MNLALGTVQFGKEYGIANREGKPDRGEVDRILESAWQSDVRSFDTAPVYGNSEAILGEFLLEKPRHRATILTKLDYLDQTSPTHSSLNYQHKFLDSVQGSLSKLRLRKADAILLQQRPLIQSMNDSIAEALSSLKQKDLTQQVGVSVYNPAECQQVLKHLQPDILEVPFNLFDRRCGKFIQENQDQLSRTEIWVRSVFLQGVVFLTPAQLPKILAPISESLRALRAFQNQRGFTTEEIALSFVRQQDWIDTVILGVDSRDQFESNRVAFQNPIDLTGLRDFREMTIPDQNPYLNPDHW